MTRRGRRRHDEAERTPPDGEAAMEIAAHFLGARPRTRWELERRLRRALASDEVITATLERLARLGYVDDTAFARWWAEQRERHSPRGRRMVEAELRQRGVPREILDSMREVELPEPGPGGESLPGSEADRARLALERHLKGRPLPDDQRAIQRLGAYLMRRGFEPDIVRSTLLSAAEESTPGGSTADLGGRPPKSP